MSVRWHILIVALATSMGIAGAGDDFEIRGTCDARGYPHHKNGRSLIPGTTGCRHDGAVVGDWYVARVIEGSVIEGKGLPFEWTPHKIADREVIGLYAHSMAEDSVYYLTIPEARRLSVDEFNLAIVSRNTLRFCCAIENKRRYAYWKIGSAPTVTLAFESTDVPSVVPHNLRRDLIRRNFEAVRWYPNIDKLDIRNTLLAVPMTDRGFFIASEREGSLGRISHLDGEWVWRVSWDNIREAVGAEIMHIEIPAMVPPVVCPVIAVQTVGRAIHLATLTSRGVGLIAGINGSRLLQVIVSPDQKHVIVQHVRDDLAPIDRCVITSMVDVTNGQVSELEEGSSTIYGMDDEGNTIETGIHRSLRLMRRRIGKSPVSGFDFNILLPPVEAGP